MGSANGISTSGNWEAIAARKQKIQEQAIKEFLRKFSDVGTEVNGVDICDLGHEELRDSLARGSVQAEMVTVAYIRRAIEAHRKTNCLTEVLFEDAVYRARELDEYLQCEGNPIGPLHGLPVSLKDQFNIKGIDSTIGYVGRAFSPASEDAAIATMMHRLGAVIIAKTNVPQSIMVVDTNNPLWGRTVNPRDPSFTPGGSTGGEAALLAMHGSLVGWGTDIGGSIRTPSSMMGLYGLKPSHGRLPYLNTSVSTEGQEHVPSVVGPMARSLRSLTELTKVAIDAEPWALDPRCICLPWREIMYEDMFSRPLTVGLMLDDGMARVHPPVERGLKFVAEVLKQHGHEIVQWDTSGHTDIINVQDQYYTADGGEDIVRDVTVCNEPYIPSVQALIERGDPISIYEYWQLNRQKLKLQKMYLDRWNDAKGPVSGRQVDILLAPVIPHTAIPHDSFRWPGYTKVWNFLDYSALALPVSCVSQDTDRIYPSYQPWNAVDEWNWGLYDPERMHGHPVGVQIVGRRLEEEKVLAAARVIEDLLQSSVDNRGPC